MIKHRIQVLEKLLFSLIGLDQGLLFITLITPWQITKFNSTEKSRIVQMRQIELTYADTIQELDYMTNIWNRSCLTGLGPTKHFNLEVLLN